MAFTLEEALRKIGAPEYSGIDGLKRLVQLTSGDIDPTVAKVVKNPIYLFFSGKMPDGTETKIIAEPMSEQGINPVPVGDKLRIRQGRKDSVRIMG